MNQFKLLARRRFGPFFATQALSAFNDNAFRNATIVLVAFQLGLSDAKVGFYSNLAPALFILPFFLFSASAGQLAEKFEKQKLIRYVKLFEIVAMCLAAWGFFIASPALLLTVLFLMGLHSTVFGPIKYAILPQVLEPEELVGGNGLVEMGTSIAILIGMIAGGAAMARVGAGPWLSALLVIGVAIIGFAASCAIPRVPATAPELKFNWNAFTESARAIRFVAKNRAVFNSVLGISWFWFFGGVVTAQLPNYTKLFLGGGASVEILVLTLFSVGVGAGSLLCEKLSGHKVEIGLVPLGALGMTVFGIDLYFSQHALASTHGLDALAFLRASGHWHIALDLTLIGLFAGFYIVPLFALVQSRSERSELSRVIAGNNIINAIFLVAAALFGMGMLKAGLTIPQLFLATAILNAIVTLWIFLLVPEFLMRFVDWLLISVFYRVHCDGLERIPEDGPALLVCNHVSFMDALIIMGSVRRPVRFVIYYQIFRIPVLGFVFRTAKAIPIAGAKENPALLERAFAQIDQALAEGELVCVFPEGSLSADGEIAAFRPGIEKILAQRPVPVVPLALRGLWHSMWSRRNSKLGRTRLPRRFRARIALLAERSWTAPRPAPPISNGACANCAVRRRELSGGINGMTRSVIVASYTSPWEAHIACGRLRAEGIHAWVAYEQHVWAYWPLSTALGGVRIMTDAAIASEARAILAAHDRGEYESCLPEEELQAAALHCPKCNSTDIQTLPFGSQIPLLAILALFGAIFPVRRDRHHCQNCGRDWRY